MTLRDLLAGKPTLQQYLILERADRMFGHRVQADGRIVTVGRYYGGPLTAEQADTLVHGLNKAKE